MVKTSKKEFFELSILELISDKFHELARDKKWVAKYAKIFLQKTYYPGHLLKDIDLKTMCTQIGRTQGAPANRIYSSAACVQFMDEVTLEILNYSAYLGISSRAIAREQLADLDIGMFNSLSEDNLKNKTQFWFGIEESSNSEVLSDNLKEEFGKLDELQIEDETIDFDSLSEEEWKKAVEDRALEKTQDHDSEEEYKHSMICEYKQMKDEFKDYKKRTMDILPWEQQ